MSGIIRVEKSEDFSSISNVGMRDRRLSFGARGILAYLLTKPNDWGVRTEDLVEGSPHGRTAVLGMLKELEDCGYLRRWKTKDGRGQWNWHTTVYESPEMNPEPQSGFPPTDNPLTVCPPTGSPSTGNPASENPPIKEILREEILSTLSPQAHAEEIPQTDSPPDSRRPFDLNDETDERYRSPHYRAVLEVCDLEDATLRIDPKQRALAAGVGVALAETYTPEQILQAKHAWPHRTAPTPRQLAVQIKALLNQKPEVEQVIPNATNQPPRRSGYQSAQERSAANRDAAAAERERERLRIAAEREKLAAARAASGNQRIDRPDPRSL